MLRLLLDAADDAIVVTPMHRLAFGPSGDTRSGAIRTPPRGRRRCRLHLAIETPMIRTVEAVIDEQGNVKLLEPVRPTSARRALVTILEEEPVTETARLSEAALAEDWNRPEEDEAWAHLQSAR